MLLEHVVQFFCFLGSFIEYANQGATRLISDYHILGVCTLVQLSSSGQSHTGSVFKCKAKVDVQFFGRSNRKRMRRSNKLRVITSESGMKSSMGGCEKDSHRYQLYE